MKKLIALIAACIMALAPAVAADTAAPAPSHFTWGADIGGSIDLSGHDMSTVNIDAFFGYRCALFPLLGVGAGINIPVDNSRREFPVYAIARTSFTTRPQPVFAEVRSGIVINTHPEFDSHTNFYLSPGIGFRLASGRVFSSYLVVGYIYNNLHAGGRHMLPDSSTDLGDDLSNTIHGIHSAVVRLGITF